MFHSADATEKESDQQDIDFFELSPEDLANFPIEIATDKCFIYRIIVWVSNECCETWNEKWSFNLNI